MFSKHQRVVVMDAVFGDFPSGFYSCSEFMVTFQSLIFEVQCVEVLTVLSLDIKPLKD